MSPPDALLPRHRDDQSPVFAEPWQAEVLAIASELSKRGVFSAAEWSVALGASLRASAERGEPDDEEHYYEAALDALEGLLSARAPTVGSGLPARIEQWRRAYLNTPHGRPVELAAGAGSE